MTDPSDERWKDGVEGRLNKHDDRLTAVEGFQKYQFGAFGFIMWIVGVMSDKIKHLFGF